MTKIVAKRQNSYYSNNELYSGISYERAPEKKHDTWNQQFCAAIIKKKTEKMTLLN